MTFSLHNQAINMIDNSKEYILCAAYKRVKPRKCKPYHPGVNEICWLEIGYRHHDILQRFAVKHLWLINLFSKLKLGKIALTCYKNFQVVDPMTAGFYTSKGRWVNRYEGMKIALEAGQVPEDKAYIEDLTDFDKSVFGIDDDDKDYWRKRAKSVYAPLFSEDLY
jgi:hypothetical protein